MIEEYTAQSTTYTEFSSLDGILDLVSVRGHPQCSLNEHGTGRHVLCELRDELFSKVKEALGHRVVVEGTVRYRRDGTPLSMVNVSTIWERPKVTRSLKDLIGAFPDFTGGMDAGEYVRQIRTDDDE